MDVFAHFLWSAALFWKCRGRWYAVLVGVLPDLLSFGLLFFAELGHLTSGGPPPIESLPSWLFIMYDLTHSAAVFAVVFIMMWIMTKQVQLLLLPWIIHIVSDMFTHITAYFPTPVLWPVSSWVYTHGISWSTPVFIIVNYTSLLVVYSLIALHNLKSKSIKTK